MFGAGMNPKQMNAMFKQLGIKTKDIEAKEVRIKTDSGEIIIENPKVTEINMKGLVTYQITGDVVEKNYSEDDIKFVMDQTKSDRESAIKALEETGGDVAEAILKLSDK